MHENDQVMRALIATQPVPQFRETAFTKPPPLKDARVAIVTTAALHREGSPPWIPEAMQIAAERVRKNVGAHRSGTTYKIPFEDAHFEAIPHEARDLKLGHISMNFDRSGFAADMNVLYPVDRLKELAEWGVIGSVANYHYAFLGAQPETLSQIRLDTGPACAKKLLEDGVNVVLLTPV